MFAGKEKSSDEVDWFSRCVLVRRTFLTPVQWISLDRIKKLRDPLAKGRFRNWFKPTRT
jgi:hypothetical protein